MEVEIPDRCPTCKKVFRNLLLHIRTKDSCRKSIDEKKYQNWKILANKRSKTKYQLKYVESGKHLEAQDRYLAKQERKKMMENEDRMAKEDRLEKFHSLARNCLDALKKGETPEEELLHQFQLVQTDYDGSQSWTREVTARLLSAVIHFQQVILIQKEHWEETFFLPSASIPNEYAFSRVIMKLNTYKNKNTRSFVIGLPDEDYACKAIKENTSKDLGDNKGTLTKDEEAKLVDLIDDILGSEDEWNDGEWAKILKIDKPMNDLYHALHNITQN